MRPEYRDRWEQEIHDRRDALKKPQDLLRRALSSEDFVDSAVIGGVAVADILAGKVAEWQIPSDVLQAFHGQYPQYGASFVEAVNRLAGHPDQLAGLIAGIKGKLFEIDYAGWLNHGHLPAGWTAELAHSANNPAWDIAIHDAHGHIHEVVQLKATESLAYVKEAIAAHPNIDVVVPHEFYDRLADHPELFGQIVDGHQTLGDLTDHVTNASTQAEVAGHHLQFPVIGPMIAIGFAAGQSWKRYRSNSITLGEAFQNVGERGMLAVVASGSGWAVNALAHGTMVGIPVSMAVRLAGGQLLHNRRRRGLLSVYVETIASSTAILEKQLARPLLEA
jgi:hypothetical protein